MKVNSIVNSPLPASTPPEPGARHRGIPKSLRVEAMSACNLSCPSCPTTTGHTRAMVGLGYLRAEHFERLLDDNPDVREVELSNYGEVFLNPELVRILQAASERSVAISMGNGVNMNAVSEEVLEAVVVYGVQFLSVSIDGASHATYSQYRRGGDFARVLANIDRINMFKADRRADLPKMQWQFVVFGHNEHELATARQMAEARDMTFAPKLSWDEKFSPIEDRAAILRETGELAATRSEYEALTGKKRMRGICRQLWHQPQINWDGKVLGCCRNFWGEFGGNAFADGLEQVLSSPVLADARLALMGEGPMPSASPCTQCDLFHALRDTRDWLSPEELT